MTTSDISVVLCTYNGERFVRRQLTSILEQDLQPAEVVVSDDCSSDGTLAVVESMAATTTIPVRTHRNPVQLGFSNNFLSACGLARSPYIAFSDQDDDWYPDKLSTQRAALDRHRAVLSAHPVDYIDVRGARIAPPDRATARETAWKGTAVIEPLDSAPFQKYLGFTMLFSSSLLGHIPAAQRGLDSYSRDAPLSHDRWIYFLASVYGRTVLIPQALARYRQHSTQLYGGPEHRSVGKRVKQKLEHGREQATYLADIARHRAELLEEYGTERSATQWRRIAEQQRSRAKLHDETSAALRIRAVGRRIRSGTYKSSVRGGIGRAGLVEDVVVALGRSMIRADGRLT